jgi:hypothetical protein
VNAGYFGRTAGAGGAPGRPGIWMEIAMSIRRLNRKSTEVTHIRREIIWTVFEVSLSLVRRTNDRGVLIDVADGIDRLSARLRRVAARKG